MRNTSRRRIAAVAIAAGLSLAMTGMVGCAQGDGSVDGSTSASATTGKKVGTPDPDGGIWVLTGMHVKYRTDTDGNGKTDMNSSDEVELTVDESGNITAVHAVSESDSTENGRDSYVVDTAYEYDEDGFLVSYKTSSDGEELTACDFANEFDEATGNITKTVITEHDTLLSKDDEPAECTYEYDADGNLIKFSEAGLTLTFGENGHMESAESGFTMTYLYDGDGRLTGIRQTLGEDTGDPSTSLESKITSGYDENGNLVSYSEVAGSAGGQDTDATYEYTYIANPSKGARLYTHGWRTLIQFL